MCAAPLKNGLGKEAVSRLAANLKRAFKSFDNASFERKALRGLSGLELKQRVAHVARALAESLPSPYPKALAVVRKAAQNWSAGPLDDPYRGFSAWPLFQFIEDQGLEHFDASLAALGEMTQVFTAEFAVRAFIDRDEKRAFAYFLEWTKSPNEHVRRLASEGIRPRLPWARKIQSLIDRPEALLKVLERLKDDESEYVRRSVGNHLNDIAKDHPELVLTTCEKWSKNASPGRQWIIERATRTLVKDGHPGVLRLLGFATATNLLVTTPKLSARRVPMGGEVCFAVTLESRGQKSQKLAVDFKVHFAKAGGKTSAKVFKLKVLNLAKDDKVELVKSVSFKPISTRKYYPGVHGVEIIVNGVSHGRTNFELLT